MIARNFVSYIICQHGCPEKLTTDQGSYFISKLFLEICKLLNINKIHTTVYHLEVNRVVERSHQMLMNYLSHFVNEAQNDQNKWTDFAIMTYRAIVHSITGFSPHFLVHGQESNFPTEIFVGEIEDKDLSEDDYILDIVTRLKTDFSNEREHREK